MILNGESGEIDAAVERSINRQPYRPKGIDLFSGTSDWQRGDLSPSMCNHHENRDYGLKRHFLPGILLIMLPFEPMPLQRRREAFDHPDCLFELKTTVFVPSQRSIQVARNWCHATAMRSLHC